MVMCAGTGMINTLVLLGVRKRMLVHIVRKKVQPTLLAALKTEKIAQSPSAQPLIPILTSMDDIQDLITTMEMFVVIRMLVTPVLKDAIHLRRIHLIALKRGKEILAELKKHLIKVRIGSNMLNRFILHL